MSDITNSGVSHKLKLSEFKQLNVIKNNEIARSVASKLIKDSSGSGVEGYNGKTSPSDSIINTLSKNTATNIEDYSYIFQTLPDTKTAMEIWVSCLITPKDGMTESLIWSVDNSATEYSAELFGYLLNELKDYFENDYDIKVLLKPAIENALFKTGSYSLVVIPESSLDDIINGKSAVSNEAMVHKLFDGGDGSFPQLGILGDVNGSNIGLESLISNPTVNTSTINRTIHPGLTVSDNPNGLKLFKALNTVRKNNVKSRISRRFSLEGLATVDLSKSNDVDNGDPHRSNQNDDKENKKKEHVFDSRVKTELVEALYKDRAFDGQSVVTLKTNKDATRQSLGHPLVLHVPAASIIPVHVPGKPEEIVGAFIIVDEYGNVLNTCKANDLYDTSRQSSREKVVQGQNVIKSMNLYSNGCMDDIRNNGNDGETLNSLAKTYGSLIEEDLLRRLNNGLYGEAVEIANPEEIYRIMFSRALNAMKTQLIYCPSELLTYFAFDYNKYGIGKSLLEDGRTIATLRAAMTYSDIYARIENSTGRRKLTVTLDEDDPDPLKTIEHVVSEYNRVNSYNLPLMSEGPIDAINTLREANIDIVIQGDNRAIPTTQVDVEDVTVNRVLPDQDLQDNIKNMQHASLGIPATVMDETNNVDFSIQAKTSHTLFNKRILTNQMIISRGLLEDHVTKYTLNSGTLIKRLALKIKEYKELLTDEQRALGNAMPIIEEFLSCMQIKLPAPDSMRMDERTEDLDKHKSFIENAVDAMYPDSVMEMILPEDISDKYSVIKDLLKSTLVGKYISENNYLPELGKLLDLDNADDTISASIKALLKPLSNLSVESILTFDRIRKENADSALKGALPDGESTAGGYDSGSSDSGGDSGGDDFGGGDDMGMGDEGGSGDDAGDGDAGGASGFDFDI